MKTKILLASIGLVFALGISAQSQKHVVQQGETVYAIARKYGVSPNEILKLNPSLGNGDKIRPGQALTLPNSAHPSASQTMSQNGNVTQEPPTYTIEVRQKENVAAPQHNNDNHGGYLNSGCKEMYRIQKKDNLYRIALNYNLTVEEICEANPGLTPNSKLKKGELLCIPFSRAEKKAEADRIAAEKAAQEAALASQRNRYKERINVGVILPLKEKSDRGTKMLEFYRGMLMAADSVKRQGTSINIHTYHSGATAADIKVLLNKPEMKNLDIIFGPLDAAQASALSDFCMQNKIRLVMPFATTNTYGQNNPYVYQASINSENARRTGADKVSEHFKNCNYIILSTDKADDRGTQFTSEMRSQLTGRGQQVHTLNINADETAFIGAFNQFRDNLVIPDASSLTTTTALVKRLKTFKQQHPEYKITLLGYPEWPAYVNTLLNDFYALDTYAYCTFYRNPSDSRVLAFENRFKRNFKKEITKTFPRYGIFGFDLAYYFLHGMAQLGTYFDEKSNTLDYRPFQNGMLFDQRTPNNAHINHQIYLIHYQNSQKVEVIR